MPISAQLSFQVIDKINHSISAGMRADPGRGLEIGGILLGGIESFPGSPPIVRVERFDPVESEHRRGPSYVLTDRDKRALGRKLEWWNKHGHKENLRAVGFFRSHTRRGLYLDNDDFVVIQHYFPEPESVFLLVRPVPGAASVGGVFFWQDGDIRRGSSYQEFPFSVAKLPFASPTPAASPLTGRDHATVFESASVVIPQVGGPMMEAGLTPAAGPPAEISRALVWDSASRLAAGLPQLASPAASQGPPAIPNLVANPTRADSPMQGTKPTPVGGMSWPLAAKPSSSARIPPPRRPVPTWLQIAAPIAVGVVLGAIVFKVATAPVSGHVAAPPATESGTRATAPVAVSPPASSPSTVLPGQPPAQALPLVEKPSPLVPKSKPAPAPVQAAPVQAAKPVKPVVTANAPVPTGSASRVENGPAASANVSDLTEPAPAIHEPPPPPLVAFAPNIPTRIEHPRRPVAATVTVEPVSGSKLGRIVGRFPGFRRKNQEFVPARPIRQITPTLPPDANLARDVPVDLKITVDAAGAVAGVEHTSRSADRELVRLAENAARNWQFVPARRNDETVSSELILHFLFKSAKSEP